MKGFPYFIVVLAVFAVVVGGIPWIKGWFEKPLENLLILAACMLGLGLWVAWKWMRF